MTNDQPRFKISEKLLAYAEKLEAEGYGQEPQPDVLYMNTVGGPAGFYPGEEEANDCGESE